MHEISLSNEPLFTKYCYTCSGTMKKIGGTEMTNELWACVLIVQ